MKKLIPLFIVGLLSFHSAFSQFNNNCVTAYPFCSNATYSFPLALGSIAEVGPNYGCLFSQPNPIWYFIRIDQPGDMVISINSPTGNDVDFALWGPFANPVFPCSNELTTNCTSCPNNTSDPNFYPAGNMVDCSFDPAANETVHISSALSGEFYTLVITNYSNLAGDIAFTQSNAGQIGAAVSDCNIANYINGTAYWDVNQNQIFDANEVGIPGAIVYINGCFGAMTQSDGTYAIYACNTNDNLNIALPGYLGTSSAIPTSIQIDSTQTEYNFAITLPNSPELSINLTHYGSQAPGDTSFYDVKIDNFGGVATSGFYEITLDSAYSYLTSGNTPTSITGNVLRFDYNGLNPLTHIQDAIQVVSDSMLIAGTTITASAYVESAITETVLTDNTDISAFISVSSYDPNFIENSPTDTLLLSFVNNTEYIDYTIHFQNTGTAAAQQVRITNPISNLLLKQSFEVLSSSHPCQSLYLPSGEMVFIFNNINLAAESIDEPASHGFVKYRVRCNSNLQVGQVIENTANIFFDFNSPVVTNTTHNFLKGTMVSSLSVLIDKMQIYPVPTSATINIDFPTDMSGSKTVEISSPEGKIIYSQTIENNKTAIDVSHFEKGVYMIKSTNGKKVFYGKMIVR